MKKKILILGSEGQIGGHLTDYFKKLGYKRGDFPNSEFYSDNSISIPIFPQLKKTQIDIFLKNLKKFLNEK